MTDISAIKKIQNILAKLSPEAGHRVLTFINSARFEEQRNELLAHVPAKPSPVVGEAVPYANGCHAG